MESMKTLSEDTLFGELYPVSDGDTLVQAVVQPDVEYDFNSTYRLIVDGLARNAFVPFLQPIVDSITGKIVGAELLVRLLAEDASIIPPKDFIGVAEQTGTIIEITEQILDKALVTIANASKLTRNELYLSINIVPAHLQSDRLFDFLMQRIHMGIIRQSQIKLEITERLPIDDLLGARIYLQAFYRIDILASLDDAGTGYGCFLYLQELGLSSLKIDKQFIDTIVNDTSTAVLNAIIALANSLGLDIVAEGVESIEQKDHLQALGVNICQGYLFGQPMNTVAFVEWIESI
ncbi:EAL domain-containing protein [Shewanella violacea]